jgi:hypothetical protein
MQKTDNDMEELFREAAADYPLKISGQNWNKILAALDSKENYPAKKPNRKKWWWSSVLLLLVPFICTKVQQQFEGKTTVSLAAVAAATKNTGSLFFEDINYTLGNNRLPNSNNLLLPVVLLNNDKQKDIEDNALAQTQHSGSLYPQHLLQWNQAAKASISITTSPADEDNAELSVDTQFANDKISQLQNILVKEKAKEDVVLLKDKKEENKLLEKKQEDKNKKRSSSNTKFYVSMLGGASSSKVKGEGYQQFRITAGLAVGYNINKRIAVEAGAFYSQKKYNTAFEYFDNSKTQWPSIRIIKKVEGECTMIELPVSIRYNFKPVRKHHYFASAGLTSYIMKKEDYDYDYTLPGNNMQHSMYKSYYNSSKNWLSVLQLSAGWQHAISKKIALRAQPYYNIPISGVGLGKLPISGFGAVAGITIGLK